MKLGAAAEDWVATRLFARGVQIRARNYRCRLGEIDLIAEHQNTLIFIEVKARTQLCRARASVDFHKQRKLRLTAAHYLSRFHWDGDCRFDVAAVSTDHDGNWRCDWTADAFTIDTC